MPASGLQLRPTRPCEVPESAELIFVPGAPLDRKKQPRGGLLRRLHRALEEAEARPEALVFVSGGAVASATEAYGMARWLVRQGLDPDRLVIDPEAMHTVANCAHAAEVAAAAGATRVILVTEKFHMPRAQANLRAALDSWCRPEVEVLERPARNARLSRPGLGRADAAKIPRDAGFMAARQGSPENFVDLWCPLDGRKA